ncbi:MAG: shikimate dehydrogenase [Candidatus Caenarcaniphilales bacterium]|nr:shikimate dehydrogenase [Candidatus Caenarcaniphilales bacterium]
MVIYNLALLGDPVEHSLSPEIHSRFFKTTALKGGYLCLETKPADLEKTIKALQQLFFTGVNLTIPHKQAGLKIANSCSKEAELIGSANTLCFNKDFLIHAENTDWKGFYESLPTSVKENTKKASIVGVGGSARAVTVAILKLKNILEISLLIRDSESSRNNAYEIRELVKKINSKVEVKIEDINAKTSSSKDLDLLINTTPIGMHGMEEGRSPVKELFIESIKNKNCYFYDLIYNPTETEFMRVARERDFKAQNGYRMLELQAAYSFSLWTGTKPSILLVEF